MRRLTALLTLVIGCGGGNGGGSGSGTTPKDYIRSDTYTGLLVEIDRVKGRAPGTQALASWQDELEKLRSGGHLQKPAGLRVVQDEELPETSADKVWTFGELDALVQAHRSVPPAAGEVVMHMLYVDGHYEGDSGDSMVLGFAWGGSSVVMLKDNIERGCATGALALLPGLKDKVCQLTEASVLLHETGHLLGLVHNGLAMAADHEDKAHLGHDTNDKCIMYWLAERSGVADLIAQRVKGGDEQVSPFDAACLADLDAAQQ